MTSYLLILVLLAVLLSALASERRRIFSDAVDRLYRRTDEIVATLDYLGRTASNSAAAVRKFEDAVQQYHKDTEVLE